MSERFIIVDNIDEATKFLTICNLYGPYPGIESRSPISFCTIDAVSPGLEYALKIPPPGVRCYRSFTKTFYLTVFNFGAFCDAVGCKEVVGVGIFTEQNVSELWGPGQSIVIGQRDGCCGIPINRYVEATGINGLTGDPIENHPRFKNQTIPYRNLNEFKEDKPGIVEQKSHNGFFRSNAIVAQMIITPSAEFGYKPRLNIRFGLWVR